jgi:integrase
MLGQHRLRGQAQDNNLSAPVFAAFVRFLLLTSARRNEAAGMRWSEIAEGTWVLPAQRNKTGVELARPLSVAAKEIIEGLPRLCDFVFSRNGQAAMGGIAELKFDQASGVSGWRLHELRRTSRTLIDSKRNSRETMDRPSWSLRQMRLR